MNYQLLKGRQADSGALIKSNMSNLNKIKRITPQIIKKGWGRESIFANTDKYCGKLLIFTQAGYEGSAHYHIEKLEHFYVLSGKFKIKCIDPCNASEFELDLSEGDVVEIPRGQPHKIVCVEAGIIIEASTHDDPNDSYRIAKGDSQK
jgi:mannose-6-phosphate isomerase